MVADRVKHVAIVADDQDGRGVALEIIDQPERALEVEIVGRLVEQQQVGLGEEHGRQRHAHAPATGIRRKGARLRLEVEPEAGEDAGGARRGRMGVDVDEAHLDLGDAVGIGRGLRLDHQTRALDVGRKHEVDQAARSTRSLLLHAPHLHRFGDGELAEVRLQLVGDHLEESGFAGAVAPDEADARAFRQRGRRLVEKHARAEAERDVGDVEHAELVARDRPKRKEVRRPSQTELRVA